MTENKKFNATIKAGTGYDAPWLTVSGESAAEVAFNLKSIEEQGVAQLLAETARQVAGFWTASSTLGATPVDKPQQPAYATQAVAAQHNLPVPVAQAPWDQPQPNPPSFAQDAPQQAYQQQQNYQQNPPQAPPQQQQQWQQPAPQQGYQQQAQPQDNGVRPQPPGPQPVCAHGPMLWKSGISSKTSKPYAFWGCNTPQNDPNKCKTVWPK